MSLWGKRDSFSITGTISVTNSNAAVVGSSTLFTTELKEAGTITIAGVRYKILKITNNENLTLVIPYAGTTASGLTITGIDIPKFIIQQDLQYMFFASEEEALLKANHDKGINGAGWWKVMEYKDSEGSPRYKTELIIAMDVPTSISSDATDDTTVADVEAIVTISVQPTTQAITGGAATFSVTASVAPSGSVTYQWQKATADKPTKFANVVGATSSSIILSSQTAANTGDKYRVILTSTSGAPKVTSSSAALTFVSA